MGQRLLRVTSTVASVIALCGALLTTATPAGAVEPGIRRPTLTVVCGQPHHGNKFSAVRFEQHGKWAAGGHVRVAITRAGQAPPRAILHTRTGPHGWFHLARLLTSADAAPWIAGARYRWTTEISGKTWATARRGSVTLTGSC